MRRNLNIILHLNHEPLGLHGLETRVFLRKGAGESMAHVVMKLLSYMLFYDEGLRIEASAGQHYKPDLLRMNERESPVQWVDCGQTSIRKLDVISRRNQDTFIDIVKPTKTAVRLYREQAERRLARPERVRYWSFEDGLIGKVCAQMKGRHVIHATVSAGYEHIYLLIDEVASLHAPVVYFGDCSREGALPTAEEVRAAQYAV